MGMQVFQGADLRVASGQIADVRGITPVYSCRLSTQALKAIGRNPVDHSRVEVSPVRAPYFNNAFHSELERVGFTHQRETAA